MKDLNILLKALMSGDVSAFERIYASHYEKLCCYLLNYTSDKAKIEDVAQDTFMGLWSQRKEINITTSLKSYLYRVAYNKLMDTYRKGKRKNEMLSSYYHTAVMRAVNIDDDLKNKRLEKLETCIDDLPSKCKKVFMANKISGKKYSQVAIDMDISIKTVEGHISKAYKLIKRCMSINKTENV